jgi:hypothetical protein
MPRSRVLDEIRALDPRRDAQRVARLSAGVDFPWDTRRAYELALLKTFAVPSSSRRLAASGRFLRRTAERHDATVAIVASLGLHGYDSPQGRAALRAMNLAHRAHAIPADEYRYTLSLFVLEPLRWNARFGWRPLDPVEREAGFRFWIEVGRRMAIPGLPPDLAALERESRDFEAQRIGYDPANRRLLDASLELATRRALPPALRPPARPLARRAVTALLEPRFVDAFGLSAPTPAERTALHAALRARAALVRRSPRRSRPVGVPRLPTAPDPASLRGTAAGELRAERESPPA